MLDSHIARVLKINGGLSAPFAIQSGVRQGCSFSRRLYCLAIEPSLRRLRNKLIVVCFPRCPAPVKLTAYVDDSQSEIDVDTDTVTRIEDVGKRHSQL